MPIPTSRAKENAVINLYPERCNGCGLCVSVCKDFSIELVDKKVQLSAHPVFGCIGCGHCMAICPQDAIEINGRTLSRTDLFPLPAKQEMTDYDPLMNLLKHRRSIREFKDKAVEPEIVEKILQAARQAPMGLPPSDVNLLILNGKQKVFEFSRDYCLSLEKMKWLFSGWFITMMRPFWGKETGELFKGFLRPLYEVYTGGMKQNINHVMYDAPLAMYFYGSPFCDPVDPVIPATYAMLAAEALGLGSCMLGGIHPLIQNGSAAKKLRDKYGIKGKSKEGIFVIFGYPSVKYQHGIMRTFASETNLSDQN